MLKPQKKVSRREIKEDKLVTAYFETRGWIEQNTKILSYVVIGLVGVAVIGFLWTKNRAESNDKATTMLAKVVPYYDEGKYDLVINGVEIGGGSIRIHDATVQKLMFKVLGFTDEEAVKQFGFLMNAFKFGAPPHGGIALGLDRLVMTLGGTENIRDVIAFPKTTSGLSLMDGSPSTVEDEQLKELGIKII